MNKPLDILAFAPHPDDVELGCGGSLILAADKGWKVAVADLTDGEMSSRGTPELRQQEIQRATALLGLTARYSIGLPDSAIGTSPEHREPVIELIRQTRPRIVLAPYWEDRHPDHVRASYLVKEASFFAGVGKLGPASPIGRHGCFITCSIPLLPPRSSWMSHPYGIGAWRRCGHMRVSFYPLIAMSQRP